MTVGELKKQLEKYPDTLQVFLGERMTDFTYGLLNTVAETEIEFHEDEEYDEPMAVDRVVILTED